MVQNDETKWFCIECSKEIFPFSSLNGVEFLSSTQGKKLKFLTKTKKQLTNEEKLINQFNDAMSSSDLTNHQHITVLINSIIVLSLIYSMELTLFT